MISSKVAKRSSVLISTVFSLFCIGCSQNSLDGLTQVSSKIQDTKSGLTLDVKAVEEQFEEIQAPKDLNPINNQASSVENKEKRPCPPPPPPCGEKKIAEGDTKLEQNQSQPNNVGDVAVLQTLSVETEQVTTENKEKRPCPPPPPPCGEKKIAEGDTKLEQNQSQPNNVDKKECKKDEQGNSTSGEKMRKAPPPKEGMEQNSTTSGETTRKAPPPPKEGMEQNSTTSSETTRKAPPPPQKGKGGSQKAPPKEMNTSTNK